MAEYNIYAQQRVNITSEEIVLTGPDLICISDVSITGSLELNGTPLGPASPPTIGPFSLVDNPKGLSIQADAISLVSASLTNPGALSVGDQTMPSGTKTFQHVKIPQSVSSSVGLLTVGDFDIRSGTSGDVGSIYAGTNAGPFGGFHLHNICLGSDVGSQLVNGSNLVAIGYEALNTATHVTTGVYIGAQCGQSQTQGQLNTMVGYQSDCGSTGERNCIYGAEAGNPLAANMHDCIVMGVSSGISTDSPYNIVIDHPGQAGEVNTLRLGKDDLTTGITRAFISGITDSAFSVPNIDDHIVTCNTSFMRSRNMWNPASFSPNASLNGGATITAMTVRSVSASSPWPVPLDVFVLGVLCGIRIPALSITFTGAISTLLSFITTALPSSYFPLNTLTQSVHLTSGGTVVDADITLSTTGFLSITAYTVALVSPITIPESLFTWIAK